MSAENSKKDRPTTARYRAALSVLLLLVATGCGQPSHQTTASAAVTPSPRQEIVPPQATLEDGFVVDLELAITPEEVANGLMFRPSLPPDRGMLFVFEAERQPSFWMKNTLIPLDLVFLDSAGTIVDLTTDVQPCAVDPCPTYSSSGLARAVLELAAGSAAAHGLEAGSVIVFNRVKGYPDTIATPTGENEE